MNEMRENNVCIVGMGYVGLTLAITMAEGGFNVCGIENNEEILNCIRGGKAHFYEPGLNMMLKRNIKKKRLRLSKDLFTISDPFDVYVITVGTPLNEDKKPNLSMIEDVSASISQHIKEESLIILRSTVRLGTTRQIVKQMLDRSNKKYFLAFCPERTVEGEALKEFSQLPQIVGGLDDESTKKAMDLFRTLVPTILKMSSLEAAELVKLLDNSYRDTFFSLGNEVAFMCEKLGLDSHEIINAANVGYDRTNIARPGFVGGPCLEKDPYILMDSLKGYDFEPKLIMCGRFLNESVVDHIFDKTLELLAVVEKPVISLMGLAFKGSPDTDDIRGSPALDMVRKFKTRFSNIEIRGQDYLINDKIISEKIGIIPVNDEDAFIGANLVIMMMNNRRYLWLDIEERSKLMAKPGIIYDCWGIYSLPISICKDIKYYAFGK